MCPRHAQRATVAHPKLYLFDTGIFRALRTFVADDPSCEPLLLYRGADRLVVNGVRCVPVEEFLRTLRPGRGVGEG
jgi:hypothetical protein